MPKKSNRTYNNRYNTPTRARQFIRLRNIVFGLPITHIIGTQIPWGYEIDPTKVGWLRPVDRELRLLLKANKLRAYNTLKEISEWLCVETGKWIGPTSLSSIFIYRPPYPILLEPLDERLRFATAQDETPLIEWAQKRLKSTDAERAAQKRHYEDRERVVQAREATKRELGAICSSKGQYIDGKAGYCPTCMARKEDTR